MPLFFYFYYYRVKFTSQVSSLYQRSKERQGYFLLARINDGIIIKNYQRKAVKKQALLILKDRV